MGNLRFTLTQEVPISGEVSLSAIQSDRITSQNSIVVTDYYDSYSDNLDQTIYAMSATGLSILGYSSADGPRDYQYVVTDKVKYLNDISRTKVLLPYEYQPKYDHYDVGSNPSGSISICYENGDIVEDVPYTIEYTNIVMWEDYIIVGASMTQRFDRDLVWLPNTQTANVHRFRLLLPESVCYNSTTYYVRYNKVLKKSTGAGIDPNPDVTYSNMEIINPQPIYSYGLDYIWSNGSKKIDAFGGGKLTAANTYVKRSDINRLRVTMPVSRGREGWFPRIWAGSFNHIGKEYYVNEILAYQSATVDWATGGDPIVSPRSWTITHDEATILGSRKIRLLEYPLYFTTDGYPNYIPYELYDGIYNTTPDPNTISGANTGITIIKNGVGIGNDNIADWDLWNSIILLNNDIQLTDTIHTSYLYRQMYYTMQVPDICPQVHHHKPPGNSYMGDGDSIVIAIRDQIFVTSNTSIIWYYKHANPTDLYDSTYQGYDSVIQPSSPTGPSLDLDVGVIKLAEISVSRLGSNIMTVYDSRIRGGGIVEDSQIQILRSDHISREVLQEESNYYADIGLYDGQGLKKDGVLIITIPIAVLNKLRTKVYEEVPNITLDQAHLQALSEVRKIVDSNVAIGMYYVIVDENNNLWPMVYSV